MILWFCDFVILWISWNWTILESAHFWTGRILGRIVRSGIGPDPVGGPDPEGPDLRGPDLGVQIWSPWTNHPVRVQNGPFLGPFYRVLHKTRLLLCLW